MTVEARSVRSPAAARNTWWVQPVVVAVGFTLFIIYSFWSVVLASGSHAWEHGPYLSPYYSPLIKLSWFPLSSALLVAWAPLGFRATCYYYRKAYYRAFFWDPPACAVREPRRGRYTGERKFPFVLNNLHRFFLYLALIVLAVLWFDTVNAFRYRDGLYIGVGSVFMLLNVCLLTLYTFSCHALRHLVGGGINCYSCRAATGKARHGLWKVVSGMNPLHGSFAWASLISVGSVDIYIRLVSSGVFGACFGAHTGC